MGGGTAAGSAAREETLPPTLALPPAGEASTSEYLGGTATFSKCQGQGGYWILGTVHHQARRISEMGMGRNLQNSLQVCM